ncbi:MAG: hypothetical protein GY925_14735 [Actinomycetia bacterium]|nr:hypothetical protein [Actinomycetes bacterium]
MSDVLLDEPATFRLLGVVAKRLASVTMSTLGKSWTGSRRSGPSVADEPTRSGDVPRWSADLSRVLLT